jgi:4'-phosphopantetheinyl transferase
MHDHDHVCVRWLSLDGCDSADRARWLPMLDEDERAQAQRFHFDADRDAFVAAHALARAMLSHATGKPTSLWRYVAGEFGKPRLAPGCESGRLGFNISHTRGMAACVIACHDVGVDVETCDRSVDIGVAGSFFAADEIALLRSASPERRRECFFRLWTLKEAFIKATGEGLARPLESFSFALDPVQIRFHDQRGGAAAVPADDPALWTFAETTPSENRRLAVAVRRNAQQILRLDMRAASPEDVAPG